MPSTASAKRLGKRIIGYPEEIVPVVTVKDWATQYTSNPKQRIIDYLVSLFPLFQWLPRYSE
ncbi:hypothetical protein H0H81_010798 [Sphagnurus paluster]|uniref:Uncharacterized protein n=1 Tax=Sphagnurus paluster TaxID=117069 RepID=A0A9P7K5Y7_9AGAR|nr:hypothetical protein H0H81_010798 [Sphagnurus paluster]